MEVNALGRKDELFLWRGQNVIASGRRYAAFVIGIAIGTSPLCCVKRDESHQPFKFVLRCQRCIGTGTWHTGDRLSGARHQDVKLRPLRALLASHSSSVEQNLF